MIPNIPRLYTALAEWGACILFIYRYPKRSSGVRLWGIELASLLTLSFFLVLTGSLPVGWWMPCMTAAVGLMFGTITLCSDISLAAAAYCTIRAFLLAEFTASLEWQIYVLAAYRFHWNWRPLSAVVLVVIYLGVYWLVYRMETNRGGDNGTLTVTARELWPTFLIGLTAFFASNLGFVSSAEPLKGSVLYQIYNTRTMVDLAGVVMLYAYHTQRNELRMKRELDSIQTILQSQYVQYRQSRESIDLINRKYHDLKHQITVLREESDPGKRKAYLDEMASEIQNYEAQNKTGNSVLDTVLTGKSLYCAKHSIQLTTVADGTLLNFMDVMDICTIFGNALDNAIECELQLKNKEKRLIHVAVFSRKDFLVLRFENYFEGNLQLKDGLPVTTKENADYHGYGIKSIRYTAEKYGGNMSIRTKDQWFEMDILIPIGPGTVVENTQKEKK